MKLRQMSMNEEVPQRQIARIVHKFENIGHNDLVPFIYLGPVKCTRV